MAKLKFKTDKMFTDITDEVQRLVPKNFEGLVNVYSPHTTCCVFQLENEKLHLVDVRFFLDKQVPEETLKQIFDTARWTPSGTNVQPWEVCVASGSTLERIRQGYVNNFDEGVKVVTDHRGDGRAGAPWKERKRSCARALYQSMDIEWEDKAGRGYAARRNYEFFDAPHAVFLGMHDVFGTQSACDVGMYAQTLMLAMTSHGLASCAQGTLRNYPDLVREVFGLDPEIKILFGISFGYEDRAAKVNTARTDRAPLEETVQFLR